MKKTIFIILFLCISNVARSNVYKSHDFMHCNRRVYNFKQFCYIERANHNVMTSFNNTFKFDLDSSNAIQGSLSDFINVNNITQLVSNGFTPYLTFDYNWNGSQDCWIGMVYNANVFVYINDLKTHNPLLPNPHNGYTKFREPLLNWQSQTDNANNKVFISTKFKIINERSTQPSPLRQPLQCKFNVENVHIEFDHFSIADSLAKLKKQYLTLNRLVITEIMLNSALLNTQVNNKHLIIKAIDMAKNIEGESTNNLSLEAQKYLSFLISMAAENNTFNLNDIDPFIWLVNNEEKLRQDVQFSEENNFFPKKESFMQENKIINYQGYENAVHFANDYEQLMETIKLAWTFAHLTGDALAVAKLPENSWLYQVPLK